MPNPNHMYMHQLGCTAQHQEKRRGANPTCMANPNYNQSESNIEQLGWGYAPPVMLCVTIKSVLRQ